MIPKRFAQHRRTSAQIAPVEMAPAQATPADPAFLETRVDGHAAAMDFTRRWPDLSVSRNLEASELSPISNSYTDTQTAADAEQKMPLIWPDAGRAKAPQIELT